MDATQIVTDSIHLLLTPRSSTLSPHIEEHNKRNLNRGALFHQSDAAAANKNNKQTLCYLPLCIIEYRTNGALGSAAKKLHSFFHFLQCV